VGESSTAVALSSSTNAAAAGQSVTFTATISVVAPGMGLTSGTVTFMDGTVVLGTAKVNPFSGTARLTTSFAAAGGHAITAVYSGDVNFVGSSSQALTEQVSAARQAAPFDSSALSYLSTAYNHAYYAYYYGSHSVSAYYAYIDSYNAYFYAQQAVSTHSASDWYNAYTYAAAAESYAYQDYATSGNGYAYYAYVNASYGYDNAHNAYAYYPQP